MEHQQIIPLLNESNDSKFVPRKWNIVNEQSKANYDAVKDIIKNKQVSKSSLCDFNDACILVTSEIVIIGHQMTQPAFKNYVPFLNIQEKLMEQQLVMPMYNLIEYSPNYFKITGSLWFLMLVLLMIIIVNLL